jgi:hypothetical protein
METVYPDELRSTFPGPKPDRNQVKRWFALKTKTGEAASNQMAAFYLLLCEADPKKSEGEGPTAPKATARKSEAASKRKLRQAAVPSAPSTGNPPFVGKESDTSVLRASGNDEIPSLHIDVQIHISADASAEQIDQVFASMAKHIYRKE